jgi:hypothetical protein
MAVRDGRCGRAKSRAVAIAVFAACVSKTRADGLAARLSA